MRALALLFLFFGPVLSAPVGAGLWAWRQFRAEPNAPVYGLAAGAVAGLVIFGLIRRRGLLREVTMLVMSSFWAGWLWMALTDRRYDWTQAPALHAPDGVERFALLLIVLVYLMLYVVAEESWPGRVT